MHYVYVNMDNLCKVLWIYINIMYVFSSMYIEWLLVSIDWTCMTLSLRTRVANLLCVCVFFVNKRKTQIVFVWVVFSLSSINTTEWLTCWSTAYTMNVCDFLTYHHNSSVHINTTSAWNCPLRRPTPRWRTTLTWSTPRWRTSPNHARHPWSK